MVISEYGINIQVHNNYFVKLYIVQNYQNRVGIIERR